jgi:hypothetical protein
MILGVGYNMKFEINKFYRLKEDTGFSQILTYQTSLYGKIWFLDDCLSTLTITKNSIILTYEKGTCDINNIPIEGCVTTFR